jgi:hypothetical protein
MQSIIYCSYIGTQLILVIMNRFCYSHIGHWSTTENRPDYKKKQL